MEEGKKGKGGGNKIKRNYCVYFIPCFTFHRRPKLHKNSINLYGTHPRCALSNKYHYFI
jgi:hypothetical protein